MNPAAPGTDWDAYYRKPFVATSVTRRITARRLLRHVLPNLPATGVRIIEWGGANSCFMDTMRSALRPAAYTVYDNNELGLALLRARASGNASVQAICRDVLAPDNPAGTGTDAGADLVYSVGLIEHFGPADTARAIQSHFASARQGGFVLITFPTPTWLYRLARRSAEWAHRWPFHDERPLLFDEVQSEMGRWGDAVATDLIWPIVFTQGLCLYRKR